VDNADGLEQLVVVCVGLDAPIQRHLEDLQTRSRLYRGLTRAQLLAIVVNESVPGGWLEFLGMVTFSESSDEALAERESVQSIQQAAAKVAAKVHEEALQTREESPAETGAVAEGDVSDILEPMPETSTVWDTSGNTMSKPTSLLFDPFLYTDEVPIAMFSARWNARNKSTERTFRAVRELLRGRRLRTFMADSGIEEESGVSAKHLQMLRAKKGVMFSVCTADYAEMTASPFSSYAELRFAFDNGIEIVPLIVDEIYPPQPPWGKDHPFDKEGLAQGLIDLAMPPSRKYLDCRRKTKEQIADEIEAALKTIKAKVDGQTAVAATRSRLRDAQMAAKAANQQRLEVKMREAGERRARAEALLDAKLDEVAAMKKSAGK